MSEAKVAVGARSCLTSSCKISHLGMNPVRGGRPPRESSIRGRRVVMTGVFVQAVAKELMLVVLFSFNDRKREVVMAR